jgi:Raf kinase inhibitor-like YbhB/YbcL family protein
MQAKKSTEEYGALKVTSSVFKPNGYIPVKYTCKGEDINPPLDISGIPAHAKCLALIIDDPDAPDGTWLHWMVWNVPVTHHLMEDDIPGQQGRNDFGRNTYGGPCPPSGIHRYFFKVFALDEILDLA